MGLNISAIANSDAINPVDVWNYPDESDFAYRNDHARFERDCKIYDGLLEDYETSRGELNSFRIGYGDFFKIRVALSKPLGFYYYKKDPHNPFDLWLEMGRKSTQEAQLIQDFFLHSDCDGLFDVNHVKQLARELDELKASQLSATKHLPEFYEFVKFSANNNLMWEFE
ncbi:hypothetical protein [Levilactobacillus sp. HBUAS70063]|uniref:hypothetical protein n=1 Tax=Levilactobacillus sp. HBUAS70063 TaxID=3109359 RepID=UPI00313354CA